MFLQLEEGNFMFKQIEVQYLPETTVTGPVIFDSRCFVKFFTMPLINVVFPTLGGPTIATTSGGGSTGVRSTTGIWCFLSFASSVLQVEAIQIIIWIVSTIKISWQITMFIQQYYVKESSNSRMHITYINNCRYSLTVSLVVQLFLLNDKRMPLDFAAGLSTLAYVRIWLSFSQLWGHAAFYYVSFLFFCRPCFYPT